VKLIREETINKDYLIIEQIKRDVEKLDQEKRQNPFSKVSTLINSKVKSLKSLLFETVTI
jgi:hypothetical protein